jgi:hypothetical protein
MSNGFGKWSGGSGGGSGQGQAQSGQQRQAPQGQQRQSSSNGQGSRGYGGGGGGQESYQRRAGPPDDEGIPWAERPSDMPEAGGGGRPDKPPPGVADYWCWVDAILKWPTGVTLELCIHEIGARHHRYSVRWDMTPTDDCRRDEAKFARWRAYRSEAFSAGGFTEEPNEQTGWPGWEKTGNGNLVPPYYDFFIRQAGDVVVPAMLIARLDVGQFVNVCAVGHAPGPNGMLYQAPMPRKLVEWVAVRHGWKGKTDSFKSKAGQIHFFEPNRDQLPFPVRGFILPSELKGRPAPLDG